MPGGGFCRFPGRFRDRGGQLTPRRAGGGGPAVELKGSVTVTQVGEDGSERPVDGELAAALAGPAGQFGKMVTWAARDAGAADHGDRETVIAESGRELQRQLLESTVHNDSTE